MKTIKILALMAIALPTAFISCSDDDDASSPSSDSAVITTDDGDLLLLKSVGIGSIYNTSYNTLSFNYDSQGRCTSANCWGDWTFYISYDPYKIEMDDDDYTVDLSFNGSGRVSKASMKESWEYRSYSGSESITCNFSYDSDGHLTKVSASYSGSETEDGDRYSWSGDANMTITWKSGDITKVVASGKEKEDGETYEYKDTYTYEYGSTQNEYQQYILAITDEAYEWFEEFADLAFIGYFGKGTAHLPTFCEDEYEDNEDGYTYSDTYSNTFSYTKNSNGTIKTEKRGSSTYDYTYTSLDSDTRSAVSTFEDAFATPWNTDVERKHMFGSHSKRHSKHKTVEQQ